MRRLSLALLVCAFAVPPFAAGQDACAQLGINCPHPITPQRPSDGDNSNKNNNSSDNSAEPERGRNESRAERESSADTHTVTGYYFLNRASVGPNYFNMAESSFKTALMSVGGYGRAELGLCELYGHHAERYEEALAACQIASRAGGFANGRQVRKWIKGTLMVELNLRLRRQLNDKGHAQWASKCELTTTRSEDGSAVDPAADSAKFVADCARWGKTLAAENTKLNRDVEAYNAKQN